MPCVVEICFPIRDSACILVRSKLVKSQEEKKQRLGQIEESKSETKDERHFLPKTLSCHQLLMPCQFTPSISPQTHDLEEVISSKGDADAIIVTRETGGDF